MDSDGSPTVVLTVARADWQDVIEALEPPAERIVRATLDRAAETPALKAGEVSLLLTDDREIRQLNATYRERDRATNVLSFPGLDLHEGVAGKGGSGEPLLLGDIVISFERVTAEAQELGKAPTDHVAHLLVHGVLHLLGYDHGDDRAAGVMEGLEADILEALGFAAPYDQDAEAGESDRGRVGAAPVGVLS